MTCFPPRQSGGPCLPSSSESSGNTRADMQVCLSSGCNLDWSPSQLLSPETPVLQADGSRWVTSPVMTRGLGEGDPDHSQPRPTLESVPSFTGLHGDQCISYPGFLLHGTWCNHPSKYLGSDPWMPNTRHSEHSVPSNTGLNCGLKLGGHLLTLEPGGKKSQWRNRILQWKVPAYHRLGECVWPGFTAKPPFSGSPVLCYLDVRLMMSCGLFSLKPCWCTYIVLGAES